LPPAPSWFLVYLTIRPWKWARSRALSALHGVVYQKPKQIFRIHFFIVQ
jgi:hypothetical protein